RFSHTLPPILRLCRSRLFRVAPHCLNLLGCHFPLERTKTAQAETVFPCDRTDFLDPRPGDVLPERVILEPPLQSQGNRLRPAGEPLAGRKTEVKVEINGSWHGHHSAANH